MLEFQLYECAQLWEKLGMPNYPSSLTESEWEILVKILPKTNPQLRGRPAKHSKRAIIDGILYVVRSGAGWRMMPHDLPPWKTCYHYFRIWAKQGVWENIHHYLRDLARLKAGKKASTAAIIDSQSVRTTSHPGDRGYDAGKKITGRKRHVLVDTLGFILLLKVTSADVQDREGARLLLLEKLKTTFGWLRVIWADGGYTGKLIGEIASIVRHFKVKLEIVKRSDDVKGFKILPKRWIVERTFGRLIQSRSLV